MSEPKHTRWVCIAWEDRPMRPITKRLTVNEPITAAEALREWKAKAPKLRNHTVQPDEEKE